MDLEVRMFVTYVEGTFVDAARESVQPDMKYGASQADACRP